MDYLHTAVELPGVTPAEALRTFTDATAVSGWWRGQLTFEPHPGGRYQVDFSQLGSALTGRVVDYDPAIRLVFTWQWDGTGPTYQVAVTPEEVEDGSRLRITHGPYSDSAEDLEERKSHEDGWAFFLPRLAAQAASVAGDEPA
ncbi:SRPBCC domain-containing protein [Hamadaea sp. NPDC050747]|uniref:SRPBCC family protein n=1 Tax=Hamadaea sp. NPDC050747 TaxID=3155789 RepID=UPI0033CF5FB6